MAACPCWGPGGPFQVSGFCAAPGPNRYAWSSEGPVFVQHVAIGPYSFCRVNAFYAWTTPAQHAACAHGLQLACSPIFAVAYTDRNGNEGFDPADDLIAKLVDANGSGAVDAGDVTVADVFPLALGSGGPETGSFGVKAVECADAAATANGPVCRSSLNTFIQWISNIAGEAFQEQTPDGLAVAFQDIFLPNGLDQVETDSLTTALEPDPADHFVQTTQGGDQDFLDVDVFVDLPPAP